MINKDEELDVQFEAWLSSLGKKKGIDIWKHNISSDNYYSQIADILKRYLLSLKLHK